MTVKELREELAKYGDNILVMVDGYEGGFEDVREDRIRLARVQLNVNTENYYGDHEEAGTAAGDEDPPTVIALLLGR